MKRNIFLCGLFCLIVFFTLQAQLAEDALRFSQYRLAVGAQALGLAGTSIGVATDFSALFSNPAGLAQQREGEFSFGLAQNGFSNDVTFWRTKEQIDNNKINLDNLGMVYPVPTWRGSLTFAFGFGRMQQYNSASSFGGFNIQNSYVEVITPTDDLWAMSPSERTNFLDNDISYQLWLSDTSNGYLYPILTDSLRQHATVFEEGGMNHWAFGMGIDIAPNLSFGVSLNITSGKYTYDRTYTERDIYNVYHYAFPWNIDRFFYTQTITDDVSGFNALFGLMYRQEDVFRCGITFRTPTWYTVSEGYGWKYESSFDNGKYYSWSENYNSEYSITTPMIVSGGFSFKPVSWLLLAADADYVDWTQIELDADDAQLNEHLKEQTHRAKFDLFRETVNLRGGAEVSLLDGTLTLRGGMALYPSPYRADENTTAYDRTYYTAGVTFRPVGNVLLSLAYALGDYKNTRSTSDLFSRDGARSTQELITTRTINVTVGYRF